MLRPAWSQAILTNPAKVGHKRIVLSELAEARVRPSGAGLVAIFAFHELKIDGSQRLLEADG